MIKERRTYTYTPGPKVYTIGCDHCHKIIRMTGNSIKSVKDTLKTQYGWTFIKDMCFCKECSNIEDDGE